MRTDRPLFSKPGPGRRALADPDLVVVSHGPDHCALVPRTARADRFLDAHISADCAEEEYCGAGWKVAWPALRDVLVIARGVGLVVEE